MNPRAATPIPVLAMLALLTAFSAGACKNTAAPHGSPVLLKAYWQVKGEQRLIWPVDDRDATPMPPVSPAPTQFNLVFDRVLDGAKIENSVTINGVSRPTAKPYGVPVSSGGPPVTTSVTDPRFSLSVWYNSLPLTGEVAGTSYIYGRETPSYPSATPITITLDKSAITSQYNEPMTGPDSITVTTEAFKLIDAVPLPPPAAVADAGGDAADADVDATSGAAVDGGVDFKLPHGQTVPVNYWMPLQFNNRPADAETVLPQFVHVTSNGVAVVDFKLVPDPGDPTLIYLQPPLRTTWAQGARIDVTIDAALPDVYDEVLGVAGSASFVACSGPGCSPGDGGGSTTDGTVGADAASDAPQATDAGDDAGTD